MGETGQCTFSYLGNSKGIDLFFSGCHYEFFLVCILLIVLDKNWEEEDCRASNGGTPLSPLFFSFISLSIFLADKSQLRRLEHLFYSNFNLWREEEGGLIIFFS